MLGFPYFIQAVAYIIPLKTGRSHLIDGNLQLGLPILPMLTTKLATPLPVLLFRNHVFLSQVSIQFNSIYFIFHESITRHIPNGYRNGQEVL
jgi:hypothetical protein